MKANELAVLFGVLDVYFFPRRNKTVCFQQTLAYSCIYLDRIAFDCIRTVRCSHYFVHNMLIVCFYYYSEISFKFCGSISIYSRSQGNAIFMSSAFGSVVPMELLQVIYLKFLKSCTIISSIINFHPGSKVKRKQRDKIMPMRIKRALNKYYSEY